jgi:hypothetical protein
MQFCPATDCTVHWLLPNKQVTGEPLKPKQNMFDNIKAIKLPAGVAKVDGADEIAKAVAAFCPSGGNEEETEIVAKLIADSGIAVQFQ